MTNESPVTTQPNPGHLSGRLRWAKLIAGIVVLLSASYGTIRWYRHYRYPYGPSHSCIKVLGLALSNYADSHDGIFPHGEKTPEASLSLLANHGQNFLGDLEGAVEILRGKTIPSDRVRSRLAARRLLDPETCGWHYVEGLTTKDDHALAIVWDKVGLGHNGERLSEGGHEVLFVDGSRRMVNAKEWPEFLQHQSELRAARAISSENTQAPVDE